MLAALSIATRQRSRTILLLTSQMRTIRGRSSINNIKRLSRRSIATTAAAMVTVMITTTKTAATVKAHGSPSGAGCLAPQGIAHRSVSASVAFNSLRIAVRHQYKHNRSVHRPDPRGAPPFPPLVMRSRCLTRGQSIRNGPCTDFLNARRSGMRYDTVWSSAWNSFTSSAPQRVLNIRHRPAPIEAPLQGLLALPTYLLELKRIDRVRRLRSKALDSRRRRMHS